MVNARKHTMSEDTPDASGTIQPRHRAGGNDSPCAIVASRTCWASLTTWAPQQLLWVLRISWAGVCEALHVVLTVLAPWLSYIIKFTANWVVSASQRVSDGNHMGKQKAPQLWSWALVSACAGRESCHYIMMHLSKWRFVFWETDVPCSC